MAIVTLILTDEGDDQLSLGVTSDPPMPKDAEAATAAQLAGSWAARMLANQMLEFGELINEIREIPS